jgi:hypothetical protein
VVPLGNPPDPLPTVANPNPWYPGQNNQVHQPAYEWENYSGTAAAGPWPTNLDFGCSYGARCATTSSPPGGQENGFYVDAISNATPPPEYNYTDPIDPHPVIAFTEGGPTPTPTPTPAAPVATDETSITSNSFQANWNVVSLATGYRVDVSTSNTFASFIPTYENRDVFNVLLLNVTGLNPSTTYYYRVQAYNSAGTGAESNVITAVTTAGATPTPTPTPPSSLAATATSSSQINLTWSDNSPDETGFRIERGLNASSFSFIVDKAAGTVTHSDTGLTPSTTYYYRVRADKGSLFSDWSNTANATTTTPTPTPTPGVLGQGAIKAKRGSR